MSADEEYEVEKIEGVRTKNGKKYYHVKWKGFSDADNTWEPVDSLTNCKVKIKEFEARQAKGQTQMESEDPVKAGSSRGRKKITVSVNPITEFEAQTKFQVLKRLVSGSGSDQEVSFKVLVKKTKKEQVLEHQELLRQDPLSLCLFYEQHILED